MFGARWDPGAKRWFAPRAGMPGLARWAAQPEVPDLLPGEDRIFGAGLFPDMVPASCWFTNVRSATAPVDWERLRRMINRRAGQRCEACGRGEDRSTRRWLEAHERWAYDPATSVQSLRRLICLCSDCHGATHFGLAQIRGVDDEARAHLQAVTGMSWAEVDQQIDEAFELWQARSSRDWALDLSILTGAGITLASPPEASERYHLAEAGVAAAAPPVAPTTPPDVRPSHGPRPEVSTSAEPLAGRELAALYGPRGLGLRPLGARPEYPSLGPGRRPRGRR